MESTEWLQRRTLEYKIKIDELNDTCAQLKEQLATKEFNEYEQEIRIRDLKAQLKELSDVEDKLSLANRNARVLEEENNSLLMKLKTGEEANNNISNVRGEAVKLIEENNRLLVEVEELRSTINKAYQREYQLDQKCKGLMEQQEKNETQIISLKKRNTELEERLREEQQQLILVKEAWENEKVRCQQDYEDLLASVQRFDGSAQQRETRDLKERGSEQKLQQTFLKEDIAELEEKLRLAEERFRSKERDWKQVENSLINEINTLKDSKDQNEKDVYRAFQDQLASFKQEVKAFRGDRRSSRVMPNISFENSSFDDGDDRIGELESDLILKENRIEALETLNRNMEKKNLFLTKENEEYREEINRLQDENFHIEEKVNEREVRIKELEVLLVSAQKNSGLPKIIKIDRDLKSDKYTDDEKDITLQENKKIRELLLQHEQEITELKAAYEQQLAVYEARQSEQQAQIVELLRQNDIIRQRASILNSRKDSNTDLLQEYHEFITKENEQNTRSKGKSDYFLLDKLSKDKMDSIEDIMRILEATWLSEEEGKKQIKKLSRQVVDIAAIAGNSNQRLNDEEFRKFTQMFEDREDQRQRDIHRLESDKDRLINQVDALQHDNKLKENKIRDLQDRLSDFEKRLIEDERKPQKKKNDNLKENDIENRIKMLEAAVAQKEADINGITKTKDKRLQELNDQLNTLRDANDGLWKQLVTLQDEKQDSHPRPSSGRTSKTPRGSARRRSMEHLVYSQPSTQMSEERRRTVVAEGAHLAVTIVELSDVLRNGKPITEPGYIIIKVKSVKEKYKTSVKELASVIRFDETFVFYLAQPDEDIITLHVFYKPKTSSREYHIGDASFTMATLYRGVPRQRIAVLAQNPGTKDARRSAQVEVIMQSDDFGKMAIPTEAEIEDEKLRFNELLKRVEVNDPENLHCVDVMMAMNNGR